MDLKDKICDMMNETNDEDVLKTISKYLKQEKRNKVIEKWLESGKSPFRRENEYTGWCLNRCGYGSPEYIDHSCFRLFTLDGLKLLLSNSEKFLKKCR
jgi:hypothetical protein